MQLRIIIVIMAFAMTIYLWDTARGQDLHLIELQCNTESHERTSDAEKASKEVYDFLRNHGADPGYNATKHVTIGNDDYYGHAACDGNIRQDKCRRCIGIAYNLTITKCAFRNGGQVKYGSCRFRVENYAFDPNW